MRGHPERGADYLDSVVRDFLLPLAVGLSVLFAVLGIANLLTLPREIAVRMGPLTLGSALILGAAALAMRLRPLPARFAQAAAVAMVAIAWINSFAHLFLTKEPYLTTNFMLILLGAGAVLLSRKWFSLVTAAVWISWLAVAMWRFTRPPWLHFAFALLSSTILAFIILETRLRSYRRLRDQLQEIQTAHGELMKVHSELKTDTPQELPLIDVAAALHSGLSDQKRAERSLRVAETLAATGRLAATIAHEINNPLSAITNLVYLAQHTPELPPAAAQRLDQVQGELRRISHIVKQTLAFHRESSTPAPMNIGVVLESVLVRYENLIRESGIRLEKQLYFDGTLMGYQNDIAQVFSNLIANAVEAMPNGGRLIVRTSSAHGRGDHAGASILIADTGPGISPEQRRSIFEPFFTTKGEKGTGLGLWVSCGIIKKYEGTIRMRSCIRPGNSWTAFRVFIPHTMATAGVEHKRRYERAA